MAAEIAAPRQRGDAAEAAALRHLLAAGLKPVAANANYRGGEIDLVMQDRDVLVFVEVRFRKSQAFGGGAASVDFAKRRKLVVAAQMFLVQHPKLANASCRFDVVEASGDPAAPAMNWIRDAFRADDF